MHHELKLFYKYQRIDENLIDNLEKDQVWMSNPSNFNDPFELHTHFLEGGLKYSLELTPAREEVLAMVKDRVNTAGVSCFSLQSDLLLMWAHYADQHKGLVLGYNKISQDVQLKNVVYFPKNHVPHLFLRDDLVEQDALNVLSLKAEVWSYEREHRIITPYHSEPLKGFGRLNTVIFGCRTSDEDIDKVLTVLDNNYDITKLWVGRMSNQNVMSWLSKRSAIDQGIDYHRNTWMGEDWNSRLLK